MRAETALFPQRERVTRTNEADRVRQPPSLCRAHPETESSIYRWRNAIKIAAFASTSEVQAAFSKAKVLNAERVRFAISGGQHRLIVAFDFEKQIAFVKFIGTHAEYDAVDAFTVAMF